MSLCPSAVRHREKSGPIKFKRLKDLACLNSNHVSLAFPSDSGLGKPLAGTP